jgi:hypothetical protein
MIVFLSLIMLALSWILLFHFCLYENGSILGFLF